MLDPKRIVKPILIAACSIFAIVYMYNQVIGVSKGNIETESVPAATVENTLSSDGVIFRTETVLDNPSRTGSTLAIVSDGEKVASGQSVANVYQNEADADTKARIDEIDENLRILRSSIIDQEYFSADVGKLEKERNEVLQSIQKSKVLNDFADCVGKKDELLVDMNKLQTVKSNVSFDEKIAQLQKEREMLASGSSSDFTRVYAPQAGYYESSVDGYETIFTSELLENLTADSFDAAMGMSADETAASYSAGKLITDSRWYAVCSVERAKADPFAVGKVYTVRFPYSYNTSVKMTLDKIVSETDKSYDLLVFTTNTMPEGFTYVRKQKMQIVSESYSGLKVPKEAMRVIDGVKGVYVLVGDKVVFKTAEDIYEIDDSYIVRQVTAESDPQNEDAPQYDTIALYDSVIVRGKDLFDGKRID